MILMPAKPGDPPCVICGRPSDLEVFCNHRRTQFCNVCRRILAAAFRLGEPQPNVPMLIDQSDPLWSEQLPLHGE